MDEARLPFRMSARVSRGELPAAWREGDPLPPGWVRIPVSIQLALPAEIMRQVEDAAADGAGGGRWDDGGP